MATTATITPTLGSAPVTLQAGSYSAIDDRRFWGSGLGEGYLSTGSYQVIQRAAGANMTVDVASSVGEGAVVTGDSVTAQGKYFVPPTAANVNVDIATADATNPRNDLVVLEIKDDQHDASGLNLARVRVITGTPNASAALTDAPGANGTPALPSSCMPLAVVRVAAGATSIATAAISDRRPAARPYALLGFTTSTTNFTTTGTHTNFQDDSTLTTSVTYAAARKLRVTVSTSLVAGGGTNAIEHQVLRGSTLISRRGASNAALDTVYVNNYVLTHTFNGPSVGATENIVFQIRASINNTAVGSYADANYIKSMTIEDLGPQ
jgi:hypothetical protein